MRVGDGFCFFLFSLGFVYTSSILWDTLLAPIFFIFYLFLPIKKKKKKKKNTIKINCCFKFFLMCLVNLFPQ